MKLSSDAESIYRLQSYGKDSPIEGVAVAPLRRFHDEGGAMIELLRLEVDRPPGLEGFEPAQLNYSTLEPGTIKAFHLHRRQTDVWFVPPEDRVLLVLVDVREGSATENSVVRLCLGNGQSRVVRVPPGVAHGCRNIGTASARIIYFTDLYFSADPEETDEGRLPWDFIGTEVWEPARD